MNPMLPPKLRMVCCAVLLTFGSQRAEAQLVNVRTAPVSVGEQFYTFPSRYMGMGGGFAVNDLEADPFANPATGARVRGAIMSSTPTLYSLPGNSGFGRTLPLTVMGGDGHAFGGFSFAAQETESAERNPFFAPIPSVPRSDRFAHNFYTFGMVGQNWAEKKSAVAVSLSYAKLDGLHMVDLLYPSAERIEQGGSISDLRIGYLKEFDAGRSLETVLVRNHVDMDHTVTFVDRTFTPFGMTTSTPRVEYNSDKTTTWGAHVAYHAPMPESKWQLAAYTTANAKSHPKIPNYTFMSIPRDPGNSWAFALGLGAAHVTPATVVTFDVSYEPIWTNTWAEAASAMKSRTGKAIPIGSPTIENQFVFSNTNAHAGWTHHFDQVFALQTGLDIRHIKYWLDQYNDVTEMAREQDESWSEVTLSWGLTMGFKDFQLRYFGHVKGGGALWPQWGERFVSAAPEASSGPDIVAAPSGPLSMDVTTVFMNQLGISIPVGHKR